MFKDVFMNTFILPLLMGAQQGAGEGPAPTGDLLGSLLPFAAIILIFYFLLIRPQSKKRKETEKMIAALKKGDKIVTIGGLYGTIQSVKETTVIIKADDNVKLEFLRSAISSVISQSPAKEEKIEDKSEEKIEEEEKTENNNE
jgi:preprotein translocase subunit YajC